MPTLRQIAALSVLCLPVIVVGCADAPNNAVTDVSPEAADTNRTGDVDLGEDEEATMSAEAGSAESGSLTLDIEAGSN